MNEHLEDLIQRELDGEISPAERDELDTASGADPNIREYRERMQTLAQDLDTLAWREPGPELKERILAEIGAMAPGDPRRERHLRRARMPWRIDRRQALAFAAGIALIVIVGKFVPLIGNQDIDPDQASGTLLPPTSATGEIDRARVEDGTDWIEARTERSGDRLFLRARGEGNAATPVRIDWEDQEWSLVSVRVVPPGELGVERGRAHFVQDAPGHYVLELEFQLRESQDQAGDVRLWLGTGNPEDPSVTLGTIP